ncbi:MAG: NAD(P)-dependent oxidoreductase [Clostridiales bacterium]|nr:NAD(P)-dependent oxidoreductase [Clostridiales bacterium]
MENKVKVAITGVTGNMGNEVMCELVSSCIVEKFRVLLYADKKEKAFLKKYAHLINNGTVEVIHGSIADESICKHFVCDMDYVINLASVIPPHSDGNPQAAIECNEKGVNELVYAIERLPKENQPKLIHISTVALYGNRNEKHPYAKVGDPLLVSPYDVYAATKLRGEFRVLESSIEKWVVLRQTAMLHKNMLSDNMSDGLMFHTPFNAPLEWVTAHDSGRLIRKIIEKDSREEVAGFWKRVFNIGAPESNRITGYETLDHGFSIIGGTAKQFFSPQDNATRNFHGVWFSDGQELEKLFGYQSQTETDYWIEMANAHKVYKLGKLLPKRLIRRFTVSKLKHSKNAPAYWANNGDSAKLLAFFGGKENYDALPDKWNGVHIPVKSDYAPDDYHTSQKPDSEITIDDLREYANLHRGQLITQHFETGDVYAKLTWCTQDGTMFTATAYSVICAGHWYSPIYERFEWDFDRLAKKDKVFAQYWYDSHGSSENVKYYLDEQFNACVLPDSVQVRESKQSKLFSTTIATHTVR